MGKHTSADSTVLQSAEHQHTQMTPAGKAFMQAAATWPAIAVKPSVHKPCILPTMPSRTATILKSAAAWLLPVPTPCPREKLWG